jgi:bifunctional UDP-N-acetylglucosamine pyrophosphorylase/glucosamine-1-phosphate N-acetyltransferase
MNSLGIITGENVKIGINCSLMPGKLIGSDCFVGPGSLLRENLENRCFFYEENKKKKKKI